MRVIARYLAKDQDSCSLCPHGDPDTDGCSLWGTTYGSEEYVLGVEACMCHRCYKGWAFDAKTGIVCTKYMAQTAEGGWVALPGYEAHGWASAVDNRLVV